MLYNNIYINEKYKNSKKKEKYYNGFNKINDYLFEFESFDEKEKLTCEKEIFERKDVIAIVLYDNINDKLLLIQQFRPGCYIKKNIDCPYEIVAGLVGKNDTMESAISREVEEESKVKVLKIIKIGSFFSEISFLTREIHLFYGKFDSSNTSKYAGLKSKNKDTKILLFLKDKVRNMLKK